MFDKIITEIDNLLLNYKTIGIFVSGGFDSAMLLYLMHEERVRLKTQNVFEFFTVPRYDDSRIHAERIINFIDKKFNKGHTAWYVLGNPDAHHTQQVSSGVRAVLARYPYIEIIVTAGNNTPDEVPNGPIRPHPSIHPKMRKPFFDYTKDVIVQLCIDKGLTEIMELSHTCTESTTLRCNVCWQCRERAWAFEKCKYVDPGTM